MKKLLALILCVMMFVAVIPTAAFAADPKVPASIAVLPAYTEQKITTATMATDIKNAVKAANDAIKLAVNTMAGDQSVYNTAKSMDDFLKSIAEALGKTYKLDASDSKVTAAENNMRAYIGAAVNKYLTDNKAKFEDKTVAGKIDPIKFAQTFGTAVEKALNDGRFMKSLEAAYTEAAYAQLYADLAESLQKEYDKFVENQDSDFLTALDQYGLVGTYLTKSGAALDGYPFGIDPTGSATPEPGTGLDAGVKIPTNLGWTVPTTP